MIWMQRCSRKRFYMDEWHPWFAWYPVEVRVDRRREGAYAPENCYYRVWLHTIERRHQGSWEYRFSTADESSTALKHEAMEYARRYPERVVLMARVEGG